MSVKQSIAAVEHYYFLPAANTTSGHLFIYFFLVLFYNTLYNFVITCVFVLLYFDIYLKEVPS